MTALDLLLAFVPAPIAEDLAATEDPAFCADMVKQYLEADEDGRADMLAFHVSGGVAMVEKAVEKATTPSADELDGWIKDEGRPAS